MKKGKILDNPADGQDPWEEAKIKALDLAKEYAVQLIKAKESGMKVDTEIKTEVLYLLASTQGQMTDKQFTDYIKGLYGVTPRQLQRIWENYRLIDRFKEGYIEENYEADPPGQEEIKNYYTENKNSFDEVDLSYVIFINMIGKITKTCRKRKLNKSVNWQMRLWKKSKAGEYGQCNRRLY